MVTYNTQQPVASSLPAPAYADNTAYGTLDPTPATMDNSQLPHQRFLPEKQFLFRDLSKAHRAIARNLTGVIR